MANTKNSLLWQLAHPGFPAASHLFGTMHVQDGRAFGRVPQVQALVLESEVFALEFDLEEQAPEKRFAETQLPDGQTLSTIIPPKKLEKLQQILHRSTGLDLGPYQRTVPFLVLGAVSGEILRKDMPSSLDEELWAFAKTAGIACRGIETLAEQMAVLAKIPLDLQVKMLLDLGRNLGRYRRGILHFTELYEKEELQLLSRCVKRNAHGLRDLMLYHRNQIMADRIFAMAASQKTFAAVGAGHLGGGKGVLRLLKRRGVKLGAISSHNYLNTNETPTPGATPIPARA